MSVVICTVSFGWNGWESVVKCTWECRICSKGYGENVVRMLLDFALFLLTERVGGWACFIYILLGIVGSDHDLFFPGWGKGWEMVVKWTWKCRICSVDYGEKLGKMYIDFAWFCLILLYFCLLNGWVGGWERFIFLFCLLGLAWLD